MATTVIREDNTKDQKYRCEKVSILSCKHRYVSCPPIQHRVVYVTPLTYVARQHFIHLLTYLITYLITYLLTYFLTLLIYFTYLLYLLTLLIYSLTYLLTYLLTYILTYLLTYLLTPWSRVLLEKLTGPQLVQKLPAFYGNAI